jgi:hypothetical protein
MMEHLLYFIIFIPQSRSNKKPRSQEAKIALAKKQINIIKNKQQTQHKQCKQAMTLQQEAHHVSE